MNMDLVRIFTKHNFAFYSLNLDVPMDQLIKDVSELLIQDRSMSLDKSRKLLGDLNLYKRGTELKMHNEDDSACKEYSEISKDPSYEISDTHITRTKYIPCTVIQTFNRVQLLKKHQIQYLSERGYGITGYKIKKSKRIRQLHCMGKHPNKHPDTNFFCMDPTVSELPITKENLMFVDNMLSTFNMTSIYPDLDKDEIMEVLEL